jgi:hypothetical protein
MRRFCLVLAVYLLASVASAAPRTEGDAGRAQAQRASGLDVLLERISQAITHIFAETGCAIDPLGRCTPTATTDTGVAIDPSGRT